MSILIPGMEMPTRGHTVTLTIMGGGVAVVQYYDCKPQLTVPIVYKAVPVPEHERLIDADALLESEPAYTIPNYNSDGYLADAEGAYTEVQLVNAPTIIPASKDGDG